MSIDAKIRHALLPLGDPVENAVYQGGGKRYYTFSYSTLAADFGDDLPQHERYLIQVHFFAPLKDNVTGQVKKTKLALHEAGFTWPDTENASDESGRHIVFECETAEGVDLDASI